MQSSQVEVIAGDDNLFNMSVLQDGAALSLSGLTVTIYLKPSHETPDDSSAATAFTTDNGITITDSGGGLLTWALSGTYTAREGSVYFHAVITDADDKVYTWLSGVIISQAA